MQVFPTAPSPTLTIRTGIASRLPVDIDDIKTAMKDLKLSKSRIGFYKRLF
jgi:hypothetical protein